MIFGRRQIAGMFPELKWGATYYGVVGLPPIPKTVAANSIVNRCAACGRLVPLGFQCPSLICTHTRIVNGAGRVLGMLERFAAAGLTLA
jgi:hypothetical protein